jgi:hypothetical protein
MLHLMPKSNGRRGVIICAERIILSVIVANLRILSANHNLYHKSRVLVIIYCWKDGLYAMEGDCMSYAHGI